MEAKNQGDKPPRMSDLLFEPTCILKIEMHTELALDAQLVCGALVHVDALRGWHAPNDGRTKDTLCIKSVDGSSVGGGWTIEFSHQATALRHKQVDAYLRHVHNVARDLFKILESLGCFEIGVAMQYWAHHATIRRETVGEEAKKKK